jgi:hypothetical protein
MFSLHVLELSYKYNHGLDGPLKYRLELEQLVGAIVWAVKGDQPEANSKSEEPVISETVSALH